MNKNQRLVLWISFGLIVISAIFAPKQPHYVYKALDGYRIDTTLLFVEWIFILLLAGIAFLALQTKKPLSEGEQLIENKALEAKIAQDKLNEETEREQRELRKVQRAKFVLELRRWHRLLIWIAAPALVASCIILPYDLIWWGDITDGGNSIGSGLERESALGYYIVSTQPSLARALYSKQKYFSANEIPKLKKRGYDLLRDSLDSIRNSLYSALDSLNSDIKRDSINLVTDSINLSMNRWMENTLKSNSDVSNSPQASSQPEVESLIDRIHRLYPETANSPLANQSSNVGHDSNEYRQLINSQQEIISDEFQQAKAQYEHEKESLRLRSRVASQKGNWASIGAKISHDSSTFIRDSLSIETNNRYHALALALQAGVEIDSGTAFRQIACATLLLLLALRGRRSRISKS